MAYLLARLREPSTYASLAAVLAALGVSMPTGGVQALTLLGTAIAGAVAVFLPEGGAPR